MSTRYVFMQINTVLVTVAAAGTAVQAVTTSGTVAMAIYAQPLSTNTGTIYLGVSGLTKATGAYVIKEMYSDGEFALGTAGAGVNPIDVTKYWFDASVNGEIVKFTYWVA